jgi:hypothetical protein
MPRTPRMSVPQRAIPALTWLAKLSGDEFNSLLMSLTPEEPAKSRTELGNRLQEAIPDTPPGRAAALVRELFSLHNLHLSHDWEIADIVEVVSSDQSIKIDDAQRQELRRRINILMSDPAIAWLAKAYDISGEHPNIFHTARVLTDVRPVFEDEPSSGIVGAIIVYTLNLEYFTSSNDKEVYVALDEDDIRLLEKAIARAREEGKALSNFIKASGLTDLTGISE